MVLLDRKATTGSMPFTTDLVEVGLLLSEESILAVSSSLAARMDENGSSRGRSASGEACRGSGFLYNLASIHLPFMQDLSK